MHVEPRQFFSDEFIGHEDPGIAGPKEFFCRIYIVDTWIKSWDSNAID